jgi:hypothetical protein
MTMTILKELGFKLAGDQNPKDNPDGAWEVYGTVMTGLTEPIEGEAIKLMTAALINSNWDLIDKVIYCTRVPEEVIQSQMTMARRQDYDPMPQAINLYKSNANALYNVIVGVIPFVSVCLINYGAAIERPKETVDIIANFLEVAPTKKAYGVIDPDRYHHKGEK